MRDLLNSECYVVEVDRENLRQAINSYLDSKNEDWVIEEIIKKDIENNKVRLEIHAKCYCDNILKKQTLQ